MFDIHQSIYSTWFIWDTAIQLRVNNLVNLCCEHSISNMWACTLHSIKMFKYYMYMHNIFYCRVTWTKILEHELLNWNRFVRELVLHGWFLPHICTRYKTSVTSYPYHYRTICISSTHTFCSTLFAMI